MDSLYFTLHAFNINLTTSNFDVGFQPFAQHPVRSRSNVGGVAPSSPAFHSAHQHEEHLEPSITFCWHHTRSIQLGSLEGQAMEVTPSEMSGGGPVKASAHRVIASHKPRKQKRSKGINLSEEETVMVL